jgi:hypothetical protein
MHSGSIGSFHKNENRTSLLLGCSFKIQEFKVTNDQTLNVLSTMNKTNIFVYIELSKLVSNLTINVLLSKEILKQQAGYFNVIAGDYFSSTLNPEWENIVSELKQKGPAFDGEGQIKANAFINTIDQMSQQDCIDMIFRIMSLYEKVKLELAFAD